MTLLYPWVLLGFPLYLLCEKVCQTQVKKIYFSNFAMLRQAAGKGTQIKTILRYAILLLLFLALAGPVQEQTRTHTHGTGYDIALLLDASDSMREDQRFETAKAILQDFVTQRQGDRLALSLFADYAYLSVPLTPHTEVLPAVLQHLRIGVAGRRHTALYEALYQAAGLFRHSAARQKIVILLTDGLNTVKSIPLETALHKAKRQGLKVYTIGIGDDYRKAILQRIARETGGKFFEATDPQALQSIYARINQLEKSQFNTKTLTYHTPLFRYLLLPALLLMLPLLFLEYRQHTLRPSYYAAAIFLLIALYGPYTLGKKLQTDPASQSIIVGLDLSYSMSCQDSFPDRLQIARNRADRLMALLPSAKIGLMGFATQAYLITPPTRDHAALKLLLKWIDLSTIHREGSDILAVLEGAAKLLSKQQPKRLVLFTDGGTSRDFSEEIAYAKLEQLQLFVYAIGTDKGGVIKERGRLRKEHSGDIVITRLNPALRTLAEETGGIYVKHTASDKALQTLAAKIQALQRQKKNMRNIVQHKREWYYLPLFLALLFLASAHLHFRRRS